ncbi:hypothetical protein AB7V89_16395 [Providencia manganoxydans]
MTSASERSQQRYGLKYDEYVSMWRVASEHSQQRYDLKYDEYADI